MPEFIVVLTTCKNEDEAGNVARSLVEKKLAACCNILKGARSIYLWDGKLQDENEALMVIKTKRTLFHALEAEIKSLHSYTTPEIIALPVMAGSDAFLHWFEHSTL